ncbi:MAG: hypothetical protein SFY32_00935 [Bacteroidota bacterium]|nr:hypothetical protein [Bacteroidota bacterium]
MKNFLFFISLIFSALAQETYFVVQTKGKIVYVSNNQLLKPGDKLLPDTKLKFANSEAKAILISSARGRFVLSPSDKSKTNGSEITEFVKNVLLSHDKDDYRFMSTRGVGDEASKDKTDIETYFGVGKFFVIGPVLNYRINKEKYQINDQRMLMIRYKYQGQNIDKPLPMVGEDIIFDMNEIFLVKGKKIAQEEVKKFDLYITEPKVKYEEYITSFSLSFVSEEDLKKEFEILLSVYKSQNLPKDEAKKELKDYFNYAYGNTESVILESYLDQQLTNY